MDATCNVAAAGLRDGERDGKYMKFSVVGIYLEESAVPYLAARWKGKTAEELEKSEEFLNDLVHGKCMCFFFFFFVHGL